MLTAQEVESYAKKIDEQDLEKEAQDLLLDHLDPVDKRAVLIRYSEILKADADRSFALVALARQHGCPDGVPMLPWLVERGLI